MAILSDTDRKELWAEYMRELSSGRETTACLKPDLRAAVNALDQWVSDNAATISAAIPQPARSQLTAAQKARLFMAVVQQRYLKGA